MNTNEYPVVIAPCDAEGYSFYIHILNLSFKTKEVEIILKYFPDLTEEQRKQFAALYDLYIDWNAKINVISRKDIENLYEHHVLHSLGIAKVIQFRPGTKVMDLGTGGGFPGIPLAILFPETKFHLVDSIGKKVGWEGNFNDMALKTVIRRLLSKYGYLSVEMQNAMAHDVEDEAMSNRNDALDNAAAQTVDLSATEYEEVDTETGEVKETGSEQAAPAPAPEY